MQTSSASVIFVCDHTHECWLGNAVTVTSGASRTRSPPAMGSSCSLGTPCSCMTRTVSYEPRIFAQVFRAIVSAPQRWSKCEWPTTTQSARSTSRVVRPTAGADGLTMRRLSAAAGVSYATVYNLVGSKEDVLVALLRSGLEELGAQLAEVASRDPLDRARGLVAGVVDHFVARPALYRALVQAVHDPAAGTRGVPIRRRTIALYEASIRDAMDQGLLKDDLDPPVLAFHVTLAI